MRQLQLKRFNTIFKSRKTALANLENNKSQYKDGEMVLAAYYSSSAKTADSIMYIVGIYADKDNKKKLFTIDVESIENDILKIKEFIEKELKYTSGVTQVTANTYTTATTDNYKVEMANADDKYFRLKFTPVSPDTLKTPKSFGDIKAGTTAATLKGYTLSKLLDDMLFETIYPTITEPTATINTNLYGNGQVVEIGSTAIKESNLSTTLNKGKVHVDDGVTADLAYVGDKTGQTYNMPSNATEKYSGFNAYSYSAVVSYSKGPTMKTSKGDAKNPMQTTNKGNVENPHPASTITTNTITVYASAHMYGNTGATYSSTANAFGGLQRIDGNNQIIFDKANATAVDNAIQFPSTTSEKPIIIWSPKPLAYFRSFNSTTNVYDVEHIQDLTETREEKTINGITVNGYKYIWTGNALGAVKYGLKTKN